MKLIIKEEEAEKKLIRRKKPSPKLNGVVGSGVELTWLAWSPHRPSLLLRAHGGATVLLDCALGMETMASYLPCSIVRSNRISWQKKVHPYGKGVIPVLKHINDLVYVDLVPELRAIGPSDVDLASLDAILISNTASLTALPILLAGKAGDEFRGAIYATDPILQLGKLVMENLCDLFERVDRPVEEEWAWKNIASSFPNPPASDPTRWHQFYSRETMEACLARVQRVFYRQDIVLSDELTVTPYSSGHSIGSCNWLISAGQQKIGYLAASSQRHSHPKPMETEAFEHMDALLLTSVSTIEQSPDLTVFKFINALVDTLKMGGNVLVPVVPTGLVYDLFECVLKAIEVNNLSRSIPIYFVSSIAECSFEFANIFSEWLSEDKGSRVFEPKEPFFHSELVRSGRIRVFDSLSGPFSRECRQPCIVFAGHPSLRIGEVVHLLDFWGGNSRNAIMMIDPDYPLETYYAPYKTLAIRAYYYPIETRLDCTQVYNKIISDLAPRHVLYPAEYAASFSTLPALLQTTLLHQNEPVLLLESQPAGNNGGGPMVGVKRRAVEAGGSVVDQAPKKRLRVDPELLMRIRPNADMQGLCPIQGLISSQEHIMELLPKHRKQSQQPITDPVVAAEDRIRKFSGRLTAQRLLEEFAKREIVAELLLAAGEPAAAGGEETLTIPTLSARIRMLGGGRRTLISCLNDANRKAIQAIVHQCLSKFTIPEPQAPAEESPAALAASALATVVGGGSAGTETTTTTTATTTLSTRP